MRKLFGGAPIATSSTSGSLSSDALQSPTYASGDENGSKGATSWLGSILPGSSARGLSRTDSQSTAPMTPTTAKNKDGSGKAGEGEGDEEEDDTMTSLPFSSSARPNYNAFTSPRSPPKVPLGNQQQQSRSLSHSRTTSNLSRSSQNLDAASDDIMAELLSAQAAIEARSYPALDWDDMQLTKKTHAALASKVAALKRAMQLETRLRDSAAKLLKSMDSDSPALTSPPTSPVRVTREQANAQLNLAQSRIDAISGELYQVAYEEAELRTKLLQHTAAVLALAYQKKTDEDRAAIDPLQRPPSASSFNAAAPNSGQRSPNGPLAASTSSTIADTAFHGPHFFAGNKEAVIPTRSSPFSSPNLLSQSTFGNSGGLAPNSPQQSYSRVKELEAQLVEAKSSLEAAQKERQQHSDEMVRLRKQLTSLQDEHSGAVLRSNTSEHQLRSLRAELEEAKGAIKRAEEHASTSLTQQHEDRAREADRSLANLRADLDEARRAADEADERAAALDRQLALAKEEAEARSASTAATVDTGMHDRLNDAIRRHRDAVSLPLLRDITHDESDPVAAADAHLSALSDHASTLSRELDGQRSNAQSLERQVQEHSNARTDLERELQSLKQSSSTETSSMRTELDALKSSQTENEAKLRQFESETSSLRSVWTLVPVISGKLSSTRSEPEDALKARSTETNVSAFSVDRLVERVRSLVEHDAVVLDRWRATWNELNELRKEIETKTKAHDDSEREVTKLNATMKDMEERVNTSSEREASMLERLNDLTESLERARGEKKRAEQSLSSAQSQLNTLESDKRSIESKLADQSSEVDRLRQASEKQQAELASVDPAKMQALEDELQDVKDEVADLKEELEDAKKREKKGRAALLDELSAAQDEVSSLKTQLRQASRSGKRNVTNPAAGAGTATGDA